MHVCIQFTIYCICNKVSSFHEFIHSYDPDIILGSESWLTVDFFSNEIFPSTYNTFRKDRHLKQGGGVFFCCEDTISCKEVHINNECEAVTCQISLQHNKNLIKDLQAYKYFKRFVQKEC